MIRYEFEINALGTFYEVFFVWDFHIPELFAQVRFSRQPVPISTPGWAAHACCAHAARRED